jgi:hypothetical protein
MADKVRENRVRRMAARQGLRLVKSRTRDPRALDYGSYMLLDGDRVVLGGTRRKLDRKFRRGMAVSLDEIEAFSNGARGMGTIRKRSWPSGDGYKSAWVVDYVDQHGKRRLKTFAKRKGADDFIVKARHEVAQGTHTPDSASITVADACKPGSSGPRPRASRPTPCAPIG